MVIYNQPSGFMKYIFKDSISQGIRMGMVGMAPFLFDKKNEIYIKVDDLSEGILTHEMAHSIIDQFRYNKVDKTTQRIER